MSSILQTTTYPFTFTTGIGVTWDDSATTTSTISNPTATPTIVPFPSQPKCCNRWSQYPPAYPIGYNASCVISNDGCTNPDAFWDLYACCNGAEPQAYGREEGFFCTASCEAVGQTWQQLMACLQKRAPVVVCKPDFNEIARTETGLPNDLISTGFETLGGEATSVSATSSTDGTMSVSAASSTGAAVRAVGRVGRVHVKGTKTGVAVFAILAFGSAVAAFAL